MRIGGFSPGRGNGVGVAMARALEARLGAAYGRAQEPFIVAAGHGDPRGGDDELRSGGRGEDFDGGADGYPALAGT